MGGRQGRSCSYGCSRAPQLIGGFGRFDLAALCGCHTLNVCYVLLLAAGAASQIMAAGAADRAEWETDARRLLGH